jgi:hypothetical protein
VTLRPDLGSLTAFAEQLEGRTVARSSMIPVVAITAQLPRNREHFRESQDWRDINPEDRGA